MKIDKLLIAVTFHFNPSRLVYLRLIASHFQELADELIVCVITNTSLADDHVLIRQSLGMKIEFIVPQYLGHPYLLTWCHLDVFRSYYEKDPQISHFLYLEDDIHITAQNINYWLEGREQLKPYGLIPSFLRYEIIDGESNKRSTDVTERLILNNLPKIRISDEYMYINLPQPYQGMYLLDRVLAQEHFWGPSASPDFGIWGIREKAAQGITFAKVPQGAYSRNFLGYSIKDRAIHPNALVHHTPNNYANDPRSLHGKIRIEDLIH